MASADEILPCNSTHHNASSRTYRPRETARNHQTPGYGYFNSFHTHASSADGLPPSYQHTISSPPLLRQASRPCTLPQPSSPPPYSCSVELSSPAAVQTEMSTPFAESTDRRWRDRFLILEGTHLRVHRQKTRLLFASARDAKGPSPGRLVRTYSLQHAEVGIAADHSPGELIPRSAFVELMPYAARAGLWQADPSLFEPVREWVLRLRIETETLLVCVDSQTLLLDWVEALAAAIDLAPPIEDRSEPRYRSLPRRSRRPAAAARGRISISALEDLEGLRLREEGQRLVAQQERILRRFYSHLASGGDECSTAAVPALQLAQQRRDETHGRVQTVQDADLRDHDNDDSSPEPDAYQEDPEAEDLDPADVTASAASSPFTTQPDASRPTSSASASPTTPTNSVSPLIPTTSNITPPSPHLETSNITHTTNPTVGKSTGYVPTFHPANHSPSIHLRYRRRCAPVLVASAPRASDVLFQSFPLPRRVRVDVRNRRLLAFEVAPPSYRSLEPGAGRSATAKAKAMAAVAVAVGTETETVATEPRMPQVVENVPSQTGVGTKRASCGGAGESVLGRKAKKEERVRERERERERRKDEERMRREGGLMARLWSTGLIV